MSAARILINLKADRVVRHLDTALFIYPFRDLGKRTLEKCFLNMSGIGDREIEVFRETVGFKETLLQTGAAFEYPLRCYSGMIEYTCEQPAKNIVFLDDIRP